MKSLTFAMLILLLPVVWLLFRPRLSAIKARLALGLKVGVIGYALILGFRFATSPADQEELELAGLALLFFAGIWLIAWLITRTMARSR